MTLSTRHFALLFGLCLIAGFFAGRFHRSSTSPEVAIATTRTEKTAATQTAPAVSIPQSGAPAVPISKADDLVQTSIATYAWIKNVRHRNLWIRESDGDYFSPSLSAILGLSPAEADRLSQNIRQTGQRIRELKSQAANIQVSADGKTVLLTLPSLVEESRPVYANYVNTLKQVLGPERYQFFNELNRGQFENNFDQFGLNSASVEISLVPDSSAEGDPLYSYKCSVTDAGNPTTSQTPNRTTGANLVKDYPCLAKFFMTEKGK